MVVKASVLALMCVAACKGKDSGPSGGGGSGSAAASSGSGSSSSAATTGTERWSATFVVGATLRDLPLSFAKNGAAWTGTLDVASGKTLPLGDVKLDPEHIAFTIEKPGAPKETWEHYELQRAKDAGDASGGGVVGGTQIRVRMVRLAEGEAPRSAYPRPQTPKPPFPYESRELEIAAPDGGKLAGTLTVPPGAGPFPAVVLLSGSGQQDRDETIFGHKPYAIVADKLTRQGFVVYRFDDRGTGKTTGAVGTLDTEIADAGAIVDALAKQPPIDPKRIGLVAHSTGGMVAPSVATAHPVAFLVSLAGVAVTGRELVPLQLAISARAGGATEDQVKQLVDMQTKVGEAAIAGPAQLQAVLVELTRPQLVQALGHPPTDQEIAQAIAKPLADAQAPWTLSFFKIDPRLAWKKLEIPALVIVGERDTQVPADITIKTVEDSVSKTARAKLTTKKLPELNHLFQHAKTGATDEYLEISESFDPAALELVASWLTEQAKPH